MKRCWITWGACMLIGCGLAKDFDDLAAMPTSPHDTAADPDLNTSESDSANNAPGDTDTAPAPPRDSTGTTPGDASDDTANTEVDKDCQQMGWECGSGLNNRGRMLHCDDEGGCAASGEWCDAHVCQPCDRSSHCGASCEACADDTPVCFERAPGVFACVACATDADCRMGAAPPFNSPIGICTPEHTCTCWTTPDKERESCSSTDRCPAGYVCAQDVLGKVHYTCLRLCDAPSDAAQDGLQCTTRTTPDTPQLVWAPLISCFAHAHFAVNCDVDDDRFNANTCRLSNEFKDAICHDADDGVFRCTFPCLDEDNNPSDNRCPAASSGCSQDASHPYCEPNITAP